MEKQTPVSYTHLYSTKWGKEFGIHCFYVLPDGTIGEDIYEE